MKEELEKVRKDNKFFKKVGNPLFSIGEPVDIAIVGTEDAFIVDRTTDGYYLVRFNGVKENRGIKQTYVGAEKWFVESDVWKSNKSTDFACHKNDNAVRKIK